MHFFYSLRKKKRLSQNGSLNFALFFFAIILQTVFLFYFTASFAYSQNVRFSTITTAEGLSQNTITAVLQDKQGFLWIGTEDGLNRYDGYSFIDYKHLPNDSTSVVDNFITAICEDKQSNIWIGTEKGISKWIRNENRFEQISFQEAGAIPHKNISSLYRDKKNNIWVGSKQGISFYEENKKEWIHFAANNQKLALLKDLAVSTITQDEKGNIWVGSDSLGLFRITLAQTNEQVKNFDIQSGLLDPHVTALAFDVKTNVLWVGTQAGLQALHLEQLNNQQIEDKKMRNYSPLFKIILKKKVL